MNSDANRKEARKLLKRHWGHTDFREGQWEIVQAVLEGKDVLAVLPTGGGKSICYQIPALLTEGVTLVISPLIALMQDQVQRLTEVGIPATAINSTLSSKDIDQRWTDIEFGRYKLVYVAPERLQSELFLSRAERLNIGLVAIDEAHCISEWGYDFRPAYLNISDIRPLLGKTPFLALTATATPPVRDDIWQHLALRAPEVFVKGFDRPNIVWSIFGVENKRAKVLDVIKGVKGTGIIYAATRRGVEDWQSWLVAQGERAGAYHGGMRHQARTQAADDWIKGKTRIMVATNAFGMGIDKADVRFVIHVDMPGALEAYYQEAGRAGRDGKRSYAVLLHREADDEVQRSLIDESHPTKKTIQAVYDAICNQEQIAIGDWAQAPITINLKQIALRIGGSPGSVRASIEALVREEIWSYLPIRRHQASLHFRQPMSALLRYAKEVRNKALADFIETLARTVHADAYSEWWEIDLRILEKKAGLARTELVDHLAFLESREFLRWIPPGAQLKVTFLQPRTKHLMIDVSAVKKARKRALMRLKDMIRYTHSVTCRRHFLLQYFGEQCALTCGACDICLGRHETVVVTPDEEPVLRFIMACVRDEVPLESWDLKQVGGTKPIRDGLLRWLVQEGYLTLANNTQLIYYMTPKAEAFLQEWQPAPE